MTNEQIVMLSYIENKLMQLKALALMHDLVCADDIGDAIHSCRVASETKTVDLSSLRWVKG